MPKLPKKYATIKNTLGMGVALTSMLMALGTAQAGLSSAAPDLVPVKIFTDNHCRIRVSLVNNGSAPAPASGWWSKILVNGVQVEHWNSPNAPIQPGSPNMLTHTTVYEVNGKVSVQYRVDTGHNVGETNEGNNNLTKRVNCRKTSKIKS